MSKKSGKIKSFFLKPKKNKEFVFSEKASVFEVGNGFYSVIWATNNRGTGYVTYKYNGKEYKVNDQVGGNIRANDRVHSVKIPKAHLDGNTYVYHSQYVVMKYDYTAVKGEVISSEPVKFRGYDGRDTVNALVISDVHGNPVPAEKACKNFGGEYELLVLNGDISSSIVYENDFTEKVLGTAYLFSKGEIPVAYTRGNHETRGDYACEVPKYFATGNNGLYFDFSFGPLNATILDTGEDKEDSHVEYSGLVDYQAYIDTESEWLANLKKNESPEILYRVAFAHQPYINKRYSNDWSGDIERLGAGAVISGHTHTFNLHPAEDGLFPFRVILEGGVNDEREFIATRLTFSDKNKMRVLAYDAAGETVADEIITLK